MTENMELLFGNQVWNADVDAKGVGRWGFERQVTTRGE